MIADEVVIAEMSVKIGQDEKPGEPEPGIPEWARYPCVKVVIIPRRRIVSYNRWTFGVIIVIDYLRIPVILWLLFNRVLPFVDFDW
jgi:hypothetical protein